MSVRPRLRLRFSLRRKSGATFGIKLEAIKAPPPDRDATATDDLPPEKEATPRRKERLRGRGVRPNKRKK